MTGTNIAAPRLLFIPAVAVMLNRSNAQLRWMIQQGTAPKHAKIGGRIVFREADVLAYIAAAFGDTTERHTRQKAQTQKMPPPSGNSAEGNDPNIPSTGARTMSIVSKPRTSGDYSPLNVALGDVLRQLLDENNMTLADALPEIPTAADLIVGKTWGLPEALQVAYAFGGDDRGAVRIFARLSQAVLS